MYTLSGMLQGATIQYRNYFRTMAMGGSWHVYRAPDGETLSGVIVAPREDMPPSAPILVQDVQAMTEETMRVKLTNAVKSARG